MKFHVLAYWGVTHVFNGQLYYNSANKSSDHKCCSLIKDFKFLLSQNTFFKRNYSKPCQVFIHQHYSRQIEQSINPQSPYIKHNFFKLFSWRLFVDQSPILSGSEQRNIKSKRSLSPWLSSVIWWVTCQSMSLMQKLRKCSHLLTRTMMEESHGMSFW